MFYPERNTLNNSNKENKNGNSEKITIAKDRIDILKKNMFELCISKKDSLGKVSLSQVNRFFSLLDDRNFSFESKKINEFVAKQLERAKATKQEDLVAAKDFYSLFQELNSNSNEENKIAYSYLRKYIKFIKGKEEINKKLINKEGN